MCAIAIICRLAPLVLRQLGLTDGSLDSLTYSLHSTALMGTAGVLYSDRTLSNLFLKFQREDQSPTSMFSSLPKPITARVRSSSVILSNVLTAMIYIAILTNHLLLGLFLTGFQLVPVSVTFQYRLFEYWHAKSWRDIRASWTKFASLLISTALSVQCSVELARRWGNFGRVCGASFSLACLFIHGFLLLRGLWISRHTAGLFEAFQWCYLFNMTWAAFAMRYHLSGV
jgi:hypothetical protein